MLSVLCLPFALFNTAATMMEDPALPRHHLTVRLHSAQLDTPAPLLERQEQQQQLVCVAEIERFGRLRAEACASSSAEAILCEFEEEFEFVVSPTGRSQHLKLVLFALSEQGQQYVAAGSLGLDSLLGSDTPHQRVTVPVVDEVGKHAGAVDCTLRFPSRPPSAADGDAAPETG
ncbi:hypothetical protein COHA_005987 [Chlorella ohadii]|uniref:Uncharacterized protein n=1 Tax=Chlorella ohadii TaxID=2649997 RepID=A0AAD5DLV8_9CHLO|nr:hypothetical protein COHA_005987 [Chlorella ohadii]